MHAIINKIEEEIATEAQVNTEFQRLSIECLCAVRVCALHSLHCIMECTPLWCECKHSAYTHIVLCCCVQSIAYVILYYCCRRCGACHLNSKSIHRLHLFFHRLDYLPLCCSFGCNFLAVVRACVDVCVECVCNLISVLVFFFYEILLSTSTFQSQNLPFSKGTHTNTQQINISILTIQTHIFK